MQRAPDAPYIFISYASADRERVLPLVDASARAGRGGLDRPGGHPRRRQLRARDRRGDQGRRRVHPDGVRAVAGVPECQAGDRGGVGVRAGVPAAAARIRYHPRRPQILADRRPVDRGAGQAGGGVAAAGAGRPRAARHHAQGGRASGDAAGGPGAGTRAAAGEDRRRQGGQERAGADGGATGAGRWRPADRRGVAAGTPRLRGVERCGARPIRGGGALGRVSPAIWRQGGGIRACRPRPRPRHRAAPAARPPRRPPPARRTRCRRGPV